METALYILLLMGFSFSSFLIATAASHSNVDRSSAYAGSAVLVCIMTIFVAGMILVPKIGGFGL